MKIAFYKGTHKGLAGVFNRLVRWWTKGSYSHVELVIDYSYGNSLCISSANLDGGVRTKLLDLDNGNWDLVDIPEVDWFSWYEKNKDKGYDFLGLLGFVIGAGKENPKKLFCSEAVADILGYKNAWRYSPNTLYDLVTSKLTYVTV